MKVATSIQERLWELRKDKGLNLEELSWAHAPFRWFYFCRLTGLYHTFRNRGNF